MPGQHPSDLATQDDMLRVQGGLADQESLLGQRGVLIRELQGKVVELQGKVAPLKPPPPLVVALPVAPVDGQEVYYSTAAGTVLWHLRYSAAMFALDGYGWMFVGGPPVAATTGGGAITSTTYVAIAGGPDVTVPLAGIYCVEYGCEIVHNTADGGGAMSFAIGAVAALDSDRAILYAPRASAPMTVRGRRDKVLAAGDVLSGRYRLAISGSCSFGTAYLSLLPYRVK